MRSAAAAVAAALIRFCGPAWILRNTVARGRVSIVLFHDPAPDRFDAFLAYLRRTYAPIPLDALVDAIHSGDWSAIPPKSVVVTFDDGHAGNFGALEACRRHGVVPTVYLCTEVVGTDRGFWFEGLGREQVERVKWLPDAARVETLRRDHAFEQDAAAPGGRQALSREELGAMREHCDFGSHTRTHPTLTACPPEIAGREISASKSEVEELTGSRCVHFAYPAGAYSDHVVDLVADVGYRSARTVDIGWNGPRSDPQRLKLLSIDPRTPTQLAAELAGLKWLTRLLTRAGRLSGRRVIPTSPVGLG